MKKCEYLPSAEYPAVIITTPAINLPRPSVTPEAVRNSVSMFSLITGACAGISFRNSGSVAARQRVRIARLVPVEFAKTRAEEIRMFVRLADGNANLGLNAKLSESDKIRSKVLSIIHFRNGWCDFR